MPEADRNFWNAFSDFHRSELGNPNVVDWIQAKRLRTLYRSGEPPLTLPQDPNRRILSRNADVNCTPVHWVFDVLLFGTDPVRDGNYTNTARQKRNGSKSTTKQLDPFSHETSDNLPEEPQCSQIGDSSCGIAFPSFHDYSKIFKLRMVIFSRAKRINITVKNSTKKLSARHSLTILT